MYSIALALVLASQSTSDREADMFGDEPATPTTSSSTPETAPPAAPSSDREGDMFGGGGSEIVEKPGMLKDSGLIDDADNALALGGTLFLRLNSSFREGQGFDEAAVNGASLLDAFADVRPNDRVRAYAQVRFTFDYTVEDGETNALTGQELSNFDFQLAQAWTKFDLGQVAYVTAGRQRIRWGTGRFWNPTDFVNQEVRNSIDFFDQRTGVDLIKVHFPFEALGWNLYLIAMLNGIDVVNDTGVAARAEFVVGEAEFALSSSVQKDAPLRFGADASAGIWLIDVKGEAVVSRGIGRKLFEGELDFDGLPPTLPTQSNDPDDQWYFQGVLGAEASFKYTDLDNVNLGVEYFYNGAGYDDASLYPFLFLNNAFTPLYTGRHYGAVYASLPQPLDFNDVYLTLSTLGNFSDLSFLTRFDVQYVLLQYVTLNAFAAYHWGQVGEFKIGLDVDPIPGVLPDGISIPNDQLDLGVAARINF